MLDAHFSFDFSGSGMSEGESVTWGWFENNDVVDVVKYIMSEMECKKIVLWGRNLGAATAILYSSKDPRIKGLILDTPYSSFEETLQEGIRYAIKRRCCCTKYSFKSGTINDSTGIETKNIS